MLTIRLAEVQHLDSRFASTLYLNIFKWKVHGKGTPSGQAAFFEFQPDARAQNPWFLALFD